MRTRLIKMKVLASKLVLLLCYVICVCEFRCLSAVIHTWLSR